MKRALSLLLALATVLGIFSMTALAANPFTDVPENAWYYSDIDHAYQMNLINGKTATKFMPDDYLTYAEAVKLAAAMNQRYTTGSVTLQNGQPWYSTYVEYCKTKNIIDVDYAWDQPATRAGYIEIFAYALPDSAMNEINTIPDGSIPDVPMSHPQSAAIYKMYRVGILQGNDLARTCNPGASIKRSEVAAILTRMMDSSKRVRFDLEPVNGEEAEELPLKITAQPRSTTVEVGTAAAMSIAVEGGKEPYKYQWYGCETTGRNDKWLMVMGMNAAACKTPVLNEAGEMRLRCEVTDAEGTKVTSETAIVTVTDTTPELKIKTQPEGYSVDLGAIAFLKVEVEGGKEPYSYQWYRQKGGKWEADVFGTKADFGAEVKETMTMRCEITDANGTKVTSNSATLTVKEAAKPLEIVKQPKRVTAKVGDAPYFDIEVTGGKAPYTFTWYVGDEGGAKSVKGIYGIQTREEPAYGYAEMQVKITENFEYSDANRYFFYCNVTDADGNYVRSNAFDITVTVSELWVNKHSTDMVVKLGHTGSVSVGFAGGTKPYSFKWELQAPGAGTEWKSISNLEGQRGDVAVYTVSSSESKLTFMPDTQYPLSRYNYFWVRCTCTDANGDTVSKQFKVTITE